jgi:hypothetical protein
VGVPDAASTGRLRRFTHFKRCGAPAPRHTVAQRRSMALSPTASATDAAAIAADGFVFGYPVVLANRIRAWMTAVAEPDAVGMRAPPNRFVHARTLPAATAGKPAGALRSSAWLDLAAAPVILSVPETHGRFYFLSLLDLWTNVFASVGARTTGTGPGTFAITGPAWDGTALPAGAFPVRAPTRMVRISGSTLVDRSGYTQAHAVQDGFELASLRPGAAPPVPAASPAEHPPPDVQLERMDAPAFFRELAALMRENPPRLEDRAIVERMRRLGLLSGDDLAREPALEHAVADGAARGLERVVAAAERPPGDAVGGWYVRFRPGEYGTDYLSRAAAACAGLESGPAADELPMLVESDVDGHRLSGRRRYELTFAPSGRPPVHCYWTLMSYDASQTLVDNPVERYSVGDWNGLTVERDGTIVIRIQHGDPGGRVPNWLPAPPGAFNLLLRLYWPQQEVLDRAWTPPPVVAVPS